MNEAPSSAGTTKEEETTNGSSDPSKNGGDQPEKPGSGVSTMLLNRAHTMLKGATLSRGSSSKAGTSQIKETVTALQREKTRLEVTSEVEEDDEEMMSLLNTMKSDKKSKKEFTDSDFDTDLEDEPVAVTPSHWGQRKLYQKTCRKLAVRPVPHIEQTIETKEVKVLNRCMNALDVLALSNSLVSNQKVTRLTLDGNEIGDDGAQVLAWLMKDQESFIEKLSIADNCIGREGFKAIGEMLTSNRQLNSLNISGNNAGEDEIQIIANALRENHHLSHLNLSYNGIGDRGAKHIAGMIASNEGLQSLDVSWNKIQPQGGVAICHALRENVLLKTLNLSMNGLSVPGSLFLGETLKKNDTLTYLDVTFNRIFDEGAAHIAKGLEKNERLHHLIMHNNPLTSAGAMALIAGIRANENTGMWKLDLSNLPILKDVVSAYEEYKEKNDGFEFRFGQVHDSEPSLSAATGIDRRNPMAVVKEYIEHEGLRLLDFFKIMDKDGGGSISKEEFIEGLQQVNVPMNKSQIEDLIEVLDRDGDGEIDYAELVQGDKEFRRKRLKQKLKALEAMKNALGTKPKPKPGDDWIDD